MRLVPILSEEDKKREEVIVYLWSLRYPRKYRGKFMGYYNQWRNTKRAGGALEWTYSVHNDPDFGRKGFGDDVGHELLPVAKREFFAYGKDGRKSPRWREVEKIINSKTVYMTKTHAQEDGLPFPSKAIYIVRDGRDAEVSFVHYQLRKQWRLKKPQEFLPRLRVRVKQDCIWGPHVMGWKDKADAIVRFEDMLAHPRKAVRETLLAAGVPFTMNLNKEPPTFKELHKKAPDFFRRGEIGCYKVEMPKPLENIFWQRHGEGMRAMGYDRN